MKKEITVLCFLLADGTAFSQGVNEVPDTTQKSDKIMNAIHSDIGTLVFWGYWSFNYEVTLKQIPGKSITRFRTGFLYRFDDHFYGVPLSITALYGKGKNYFEIAAGIVPIVDEVWHEDSSPSGGYHSNRFSIYPLIDIGYRREPGIGKLFYRFKVGSSGLGFGLGYAF
jgi:hypothetical protein